MTTLALPQAAALLKVAPGTLRKRAAAGMVPGYKPGKGWVFIEEELLAYLKSTRPCPCIAAQTLRTGGSDSRSMDAKSAFHLAQRIAQRRRSLKRSPGQKPTGKSASVSALPTRGNPQPRDG